MDPNEALRLAREAAGELVHADDDGNFTDETTNLGQLINAFDALDEWLKKGGFLPSDWQPVVTDEDDYPREVCGCGVDCIWVGEDEDDGHWEHDAAPYIWGDDHEPDLPPPDLSTDVESTTTPKGSHP